MIYVASLNVPVKKALGKGPEKTVQQSTTSKIFGQMNLDPETTNMDVVILGPKDFIGPKAVQGQRAIDGKHPDICVIYLYEKSAEEDLVDGVYKHHCKKINEKYIVEAFEKYVGNHKVQTGKQQMSSADFQVQSDGEPGDDEIPDDFVPERTSRRLTPVSPAPVEETPTEESTSAASAEEPFQPDLSVFESQPETLPESPLSTTTTKGNPLESVEPLPMPERTTPSRTIEESIAGMSNVEDWDVLTEHLKRDSIVKTLIQENSEYEGLVNMLDVLDKRIQTVWRDSALSADQKFEKIKAIGLEKSVVRAAANSITVEKAISIISTIALSAKRTVDAKVESIDTALYKINADRAAVMDTTYIDKAIEERMKVQTDLLYMGRKLVDIYKSIDTLVVDEILDLDSKLPSSNQFINQMVAPLGKQIFTPQNTTTLANKLGKALQENRIVFSQLEESVQAVVEKLFELCEKDEEIIRYQQNVINLLKSNRVEDVVIVNSLLKKVLRVYTGATNTGRSSTAITWCGILSRRNNTLLIDLTGKSKFEEYGIVPMRLDDFMQSRVERQFLCVKSEGILGPDEIQNLIEVLKSRLNYYPYVNIIMDPEDADGINQVCGDAICLHYITDCSTSSIRVLQKLVKQIKVQNVARKLITIDTPVSPLTIADSIGVDTTQTRIITLPAIPAMKACALKHDRPYEFNDIVGIYEEAFR